MNMLKRILFPIVASFATLLLVTSCFLWGDDINCLPDSHFTEDGALKKEFLPESGHNQFV